jgi:hypothetical protein
MSSRSSPTTKTHWWRAPEFVRSLPLFILAAVFFVAGVVLRFAYPTYALYGPGAFTFWALLLALGFICAIGGVVSWTLAGEVLPMAEETPTPSPTPAYLPIEFPEPTVPPEPPAPVRPGHVRADFGRPAPDIRSSAAGGDWYEGPTDSERFAGPEYVLPIDVQPLAETAEQEEGTEGVEPVEKVLADLERIERDLAPRARVVEPSES